MRKLFSIIAATLLATTMFATDVTVDLSKGTFASSAITWTAADGNISIQQLQGTSGTAVNSSYISAPRVYKGHILAFTCEENYTITGIEITCNGTYYGNSMTAGTAVSENVVTNDATNILRTWASTSGGTHVVSTKNENGESTIYIQNVASESNVQLRFTALKISYIKAAATTPTITAGNVEFGTVISGKAQAATLNVTGENLTSAITYSLESGANFSVSGTLSTTGGQLTVNVTNTAEGEYADVLTLVSGTDATKAVNVSARVVELSGEGTKADPYTCADVLKLHSAISDKAWAIGYILGGAKTAGNPTALAVEALTGSNTGIVIAADADETDNTKMVTVQLGQDVRAAIAAVGNEGKLLKVEGTLEAYMTVPGVKGVNSTDNYEFVDTPVPPTTYTVTVAAAVDGGTISASPLEAEEGATVTLTETPDAGWQFVEWIVKDADNNDVTVTNDQFTMPASNVTVNATFELIPVILKYAITVDNAIEGGSVSADKEEAAEGETVTLTATPDANYVFGAWNVKDADDADVTVENDQFTMPASNVTVSAVFQPVPPVGCDWDNLPFFNTGIPDTDENYNQFKICKEGEQPNVVNIQTAGWADNHKGIYASYPSAVFGTINIDAANYTIQGAGILFHLDAFTANETEVSVVCDNVEMVFTVLNTKAITPVVPIEITIDENVDLMDDLASTGGFWLLAAQNDDFTVVIGNANAVTELAGTYTVAELDAESYIKTATDSISFVSGSITVEELAGGIHFRGTIEGNDGEFYLLSISKALVGPTVVDVVATSTDDYVRWDDQVASQGWWQIYGDNGAYSFSLSNVDTDEPAGTYGIADLDPKWCYVVDLSNTADTITFSDGEVVVAIDAEGVVTVTGELLGSDGKTYAFDLTYQDPTAETTVNVTIAEGELDDTYLESAGLFGLAGIDATNNITAQFYIWTEDGMAGDYTEEDLDNYYFGSGIMVGTTVQEIFSATLHVAVDDNNQVVLTADVLCYNNTLYKVTLTVPGETPQPTYAVTFAQPQNGTLVVKNEGVAIASGDEFEAGVVLTVEATPADGYILSTLTAGGVDIIDAKRFTIVDAAVEVVATFVADPTGINNVEGNQRRIKAIENGQLFINVNGVRYNVNGARVK